MSDQADQPVRPAATVIIARDAQPQFEIFMLRRTNQAVFAGGMYVFPGGRVDDFDHSDEFAGHHVGPSDLQLAQKRALGKDWRGYWIAGIRETFEESGLLLAYTSAGEFLSPNNSSWSRLQTYRDRLHQGDITLAELCERENIKLAIDHIHFYNRWITPLGRPRRFDTRFFIAEAPAHQEGQHDGSETVDSLWISPRDALDRHAKDEFGLMAVTQKQLADFAQHDTIRDFITMAAENREFPTYRPVLPAGT